MFITPNMTDDGHDTSVTFAAQWVNNFITPLLNNPKFMKRTLVLISELLRLPCRKLAMTDMKKHSMRMKVIHPKTVSLAFSLAMLFLLNWSAQPMKTFTTITLPFPQWKPTGAYTH
jgi:hypothetical protein